MVTHSCYEFVLQTCVRAILWFQILGDIFFLLCSMLRVKMILCRTQWQERGKFISRSCLYWMFRTWCLSFIKLGRSFYQTTTFGESWSLSFALWVLWVHDHQSSNSCNLVNALRKKTGYNVTLTSLGFLPLFVPDLRIPYFPIVHWYFKYFKIYNLEIFLFS